MSFNDTLNKQHSQAGAWERESGDKLLPAELGNEKRIVFSNDKCQMINDK